MNEFDDFIQSLVQNKEKRPIMTHLPSTVRYVDKYFSGYLTEEELQEHQYTGRFWDIKAGDDEHWTTLFIILDNETVLLISKVRGEELLEGVYDRASTKPVLPDSLRGMYYDND